MPSPNSSTRQWRALRDWHLRHNPVCVTCGAQATEVDHVHQLKDGGARFDKRNLRSFCHHCHKRRHHPRPGVDPATGLPIGRHWWNDAQN